MRHGEPPGNSPKLEIGTLMHVVNNKSVEGDGFRVTVTDIHTVIYHETDRTVTVEIEGGQGSGGKVEWDVYSSTLSDWRIVGRSQPITSDDRSRILSRVSGALSLLEMLHRVV
jgi:hypothetical protein